MSNFDRALEQVVDLEKGYINDPKDPGGETKFGISARSYPMVDIKHLTIEGARAIYARDFWLPLRCDELPWPLGALVFDAAVNQGLDAAVRLLQKAAGVAQDGVLGKATLRAVTAAEPTELCAMFMADRALRYVGTRNFDLYGRGWFKRLFKFMGGLHGFRD